MSGLDERFWAIRYMGEVQRSPGTQWSKGWTFDDFGLLDVSGGGLYTDTHITVAKLCPVKSIGLTWSYHALCFFAGR